MTSRIMEKINFVYLKHQHGEKYKYCLLITEIQNDHQLVTLDLSFCIIFLMNYFKTNFRHYFFTFRYTSLNIWILSFLTILS